jgi:hypothetical protein
MAYDAPSPESREGSNQGGVEMMDGLGVLVAAGCILALIWLVVLYGSRYFGPQ